MFRSKRQQEIVQSSEAKLAKMFEEMNSENHPEDDGRLVCETRCTMARIRSFSDFMYLLKVRPLQTACYYGAAVFFLLTLAAAWCSEWLLTAIFAAVFLLLATAPHNMRIMYFNKRADKLEDSFGKLISADFTDDEKLVLTISSLPEEEKDVEESSAGASAALHDDNAEVLEIPYKSIAQAYECSHSFYLFPEPVNGKKLDAVICDKTLFICGTPMQLRDRLLRACGKRFRMKIKKA
ncbi:MAG: hypothetical protein SPD47_07460 [Oscillospiraceae bacterium]|nr:hypothetical protein [Oscillospiraceae bacterium]